MFEKLMAMQSDMAENGVFIPESTISPIRAMVGADTGRLILLLKKNRTVISDAEVTAEGFALKKYRLFVLRSEIRPISAEGSAIPPSEGHRPFMEELIKQMYSSIGLEINNEKAAFFAENKRKNTYLWQNNGIRAMGRIAFEGRVYGRINTIVTDPLSRGGGYGKAMVSFLCSVLQGKGLIPTVLADHDNIISTNMYRSLGFAEEGTIYEYRPVGAVGEGALTVGALT